MNTHTHMPERRILVMTVIIAGLSAGVPLAQADTTDRLLARNGQFQLENGETKTVIQRARMKEYRVCMEAHPKAVPLKVTYDGKDAVVAPGECRLIQARKIKLASAGRMHKDMTLIGTHNRSTRQTSVRVAREAGNKEAQVRLIQGQ